MPGRPHAIAALQASCCQQQSSPQRWRQPPRSAAACHGGTNATLMQQERCQACKALRPPCSSESVLCRLWHEQLPSHRSFNNCTAATQHKPQSWLLQPLRSTRSNHCSFHTAAFQHPPGT